MIKSMTAYGRSSKSTALGRWNVEMHSVNRKFLDINIQLPRDMLMFDVEIRKMLANHVQRGQITVKVSLIQDATSVDVLQKQVDQLKNVKRLFEDISSQLGLDSEKEVTLSFLLEQKNFLISSDVDTKADQIRIELFDALSDACKLFMIMKETEGKALAKEISKYLDTLKEMLIEIQALAPDSREFFKKKLFDKINEVCSTISPDDERLLKEVMIYAERIDVEEEITRLKSHFDQFDKLFSSQEKSVGRTMDFLLQEMNREVNTICSKSDSKEISMIAVQMKSELEKIREQIQNIE